jgi:hypothetical protein
MNYPDFKIHHADVVVNGVASVRERNQINRPDKPVTNPNRNYEDESYHCFDRLGGIMFQPQVFAEQPLAAKLAVPL